MTEEFKKWFAEFLNKIAEKIKKGEQLSDMEIEIVVNYVSNLQLYEYVDRRISDVERSLRDEIRKTREELLANDEKVKQELIKEINTAKGDLEKKIEGTQTELKADMSTIKGDLEKKIEGTRADLEKKIEDTKTELKGEISTVKGELEKKIEDTKTELKTEVNTVRQDLEKKIENTRIDLEKKIDDTRKDLENKIENTRTDLEKKIEATRSDLGLIAEEVYIKNFVDYLDKAGEKVISVYRHYEVGEGEVDALVETQAKVYVVEVKMKAEFKDVDSLLVKVKVISEEYKGKDIVPVLTGSRISKTVRGYAKGHNVMVV
ncbi:hypothetical protein [Sulfurisphaera tokodaii]|uniref:Uncharacterized protein n=2 Tax=Sulfurisphaera tokodaii TaxID=111955 RepID=Q96ZT2_SULTO|nr:hypothetical protein [Sulfurisphaera tokodaii]BAB66841.1 hypothetical protein STK_17520 [Sulfurisphaera tokodaii str. 7]HII73372.1 apolipoprotein A1/A4/E family protein [Sulfurisphaera tokodaii]